MPPATASHSTRSPSQLSSSRRSAAARSVGSMRSKGPRVSPSRDRVSSYTGPPVLKCEAASPAAPSSGECHLMVAASCPHVCISVARSTLAAWRTMRGGDGRSDERGHVPSPSCLQPRGRLQPFLRRRVPVVVGARPADPGGSWPGVRPQLLERDGGVSLRRGLRGARGGAPPGQLSRPFSPTLRASHAVMEPRLMIHGAKRAPMSGRGSSRCVAGVPEFPVWGSGGRCVRPRLWLLPLP